MTREKSTRNADQSASERSSGAYFYYNDFAEKTWYK